MTFKNSKSVIFIYDSVEYFRPFFEQKGFRTYKLFKELSFILKVVRKVFFILNLPLDYWFSKWKNELRDGATVIIFSSNFVEVVEFISSKKLNIRIIYWYWNPIFRSVDPERIPIEICEKWSFDKEDCSKYKLRFNTTFYLNNITLPKRRIVFDVVFVGADKGRKYHLDQLEAQMRDREVVTYFHIVDDIKTSNSKFLSISYLEYLELVSQSKAILDYVQEGQNGLTLRPMESLFFRKKLITNDKAISDQNFYTSDNIFILGKDNIENLPDFLTSPYKSIDEKILAYYDVESWVERFFIDDTNYQI